MAPNWDEPTGATSPQAILFSGNFTIRPLCHERQLHHLATLPTGVTSPCISVEPPCRLIQVSLGVYRVLYTFFWPSEFPGYHQWQQESQKTTRTNLNNLKALLIITTIAKDISKFDTSNFEENKVI